MTGFESMEDRKQVSDFLKEYGKGASIGQGIAATELALGVPALARMGIKGALKLRDPAVRDMLTPNIFK